MCKLTGEMLESVYNAISNVTHTTLYDVDGMKKMFVAGVEWEKCRSGKQQKLGGNGRPTLMDYRKRSGRTIINMAGCLGVEQNEYETVEEGCCGCNPGMLRAISFIFEVPMDEILNAYSNGIKD